MNKYRIHVEVGDQKFDIEVTEAQGRFYRVIPLENTEIVLVQEVEDTPAPEEQDD